MKTIYVFVTVFFFSFISMNSGIAQDKSLDDLGIKTDFIITSNNKVLSNEQLFIRRTSVVNYLNYIMQDPLQNGFAYESYCLEFRSTNEVLAFEHPEREDIVSIKFFKNGEMIHDVVLTKWVLSKIKTKDRNGNFYYSLNLVNVPMIMLQEADSIDLLILE